MSAEVVRSLTKSIREAGGILRGEISDFESWNLPRSGRRRNPTNALAVFVGDDDDFIVGRIYDLRVLPSGRVLATSEIGEPVIFDGSDFLIVKFQPKAEKLLRRLVLT